IDLGGMYLTDKLTNTDKWEIPQGTIVPANGFVLFWCDAQENQGTMHTSFKLSSNGESIALVDTDGSTILDSYTFGQQWANTSQGRQSDGGSTWISFSMPSPLEPNGQGISLAAMPIATYAGGHYSQSITIELSSPTPDASIRYTLDGSVPTSSSPIYNSSISFDTTTVLRARTFKTGLEPSRTMTHTYLFNVSHTMPIFCISTDPDNFFGEENGIYVFWDEDIEQPCHVELYETDGSFGFRQDLGVQIHGGYSQSYPHKGLALIAKKEYGDNTINYPLFPDLPFDEYGSFILRASGNDWSKTLFRDALASGLIREFEDVAPIIEKPDVELQDYRPTIVYLNGQYFGIHNLREKLDWRYLKTHYGIEKGDADIVQKKNKLEHGSLDAWDDFFDFVEDADFTTPQDYETLQNSLDIRHFTDYFLHNIYLDNNDWPDNNNKRWRLRQDGEKWRYFLYDMDRAFGLIPLSDNYNSGDWDAQSLQMVMSDTQSTDHNKPWSTLLLRKLMLNEDFKYQFINRMADELNTIFDKDRILARIDSFEAVYTPEIIAHGNKWWDTNYYAYNVDKARIFTNHRTDEMWNQFDNFFDEISGVVDIDLNVQPADAGYILLNTLKLREDNLPWSGRYFAGIDAPIEAIADPGYLFSNWSSGTLNNNNAFSTLNLSTDQSITANFTLGSTAIGNVVINEINYHSPQDANAGDWIELYNANDSPIDISGWFLEDGSGNYFNLPANTILPAHGYIVLVQDAERFQNIHPNVSNFIAGFGNSPGGGMSLNNKGEWISINNADRSFMDTVLYDDKAPWPTSPDGEGASLQLISPSLDNALASSWVASLIHHSTPGAKNQNVLLGSNLVLCGAQSIILDATYSPCPDCTYLWNTGATSSAITVNLPPDSNISYSVTVNESTGFSQVDTLHIMTYQTFSLSHTIQSPSCFGYMDGAIDLSVNGNGSYNYLWSNGETTQDISNLSSGTYAVTVTDMNACSESLDFDISQPEALTSNEDITQPNNDFAGSILVNPTGGTAPYSILWGTGEDTFTLLDLGQGTYSYTLTDVNACTYEADVELSYTTATQTLSAQDIQVFPNPTQGTIFIKSEIEELHLSLINVLGSNLAEYNKPKGTKIWTIDLANLPQGIYLLHIQTNKGNRVERFLIE
ncbi:MAG TPA: T9SS type A sorting domain-containing protein, partial [Phaeodactylibacter sp.]|nr:T9SS type A sorting domain-containing protein [Phaeodactylibacter sp.]